MATKKWDEKAVRKITKTGNGSLCVTLPIDDVRALKWRDKQKVVVKKTKGGFIISDWKKDV
jgi:hypothetical protein